jgi:TonB family protein
MKTTKFKLRIMNTKPEVSDEEIRGFMDFEGLLKRTTGVVQRQNKIDLLRKGTILGATIITLAVVWLIYRGSDRNDPAGLEPGISNPAPPAREQSGTSEIPGGKGRPDPAAPAILPVEELKPESKQAGADEGGTEQRAVPDAHVPETGLEQETERNTLEYHYTEAEPLNGYPALYEYFNRELVYPEAGIKDSVQGVVTVSFVIGLNGEPEKISVENSLGDAFDHEAKRLIENMPAWKPARVNGKPVTTKLSIPLTFRLEKIERRQQQ